VSSGSSLARARRIGLLGGTFDPVHVGHLVAAVNVRSELELDMVQLVVANEPWQKVGSRSVTPAADRLALVEAAVEGIEGICASAIEIERGGISYTADTVTQLLEQEPDAHLYVIVGGDVASSIESWVRLDEVLDRADIVVVNRPHTTFGPIEPSQRLANARVHMLEIPALEISSTDLRDRAATGRPLEFLVPEGSIREIELRRLYRVDR
jgi:nicotinate-nucleotide adenylyltransferase